ncbi:MAG: T9SS type A sorting domain-containing protein [Bacteroidetes bacterium]|nr:T9SS type A sorting domain-containing protein [Bacteroidota bacterium]
MTATTVSIGNVCGGCANTPTINCDMIEVPGNADAAPMLKAIAWDEKDHYTIVDLTGRTISNGAYTKGGIEVENLASGIYLLKIVVPNSAIQTIKFTKK